MYSFYVKLDEIIGITNPYLDCHIWDYNLILLGDNWLLSIVSAKVNAYIYSTWYQYSSTIPLTEPVHHNYTIVFYFVLRGYAELEKCTLFAMLNIIWMKNWLTFKRNYHPIHIYKGWTNVAMDDDAKHAQTNYSNQNRKAQTHTVNIYMYIMMKVKDSKYP